MKVWHIKSHNILLSGDGANTNSLQFNGIWIKFIEQGRTIITQTHQCRFIDTVTAEGNQGRIRSGETTRSDGRIDEISGKLKIKNSPAHKNVAEALKILPRGSKGFAADLGDEKQIEQLFKNIGEFDHLVFTAGAAFG